MLGAAVEAGLETAGHCKVPDGTTQGLYESHVVQLGFSSVDGDGVTAAIQDSGKGWYRAELGCRDGDVGAEGVAVGGGCVPG